MEIIKSKYVKRFIIVLIITLACVYMVSDFALKDKYAKLGTLERTITAIEGRDLYLVQGREGYCYLVDGDNRQIASLKPFKTYMERQDDFLIMYGDDGYGLIDIKEAISGKKIDVQTYDDILLDDESRYIALREGEICYVKTIDDETLLEIEANQVNYIGKGYVAITDTEDRDEVIEISTGRTVYKAPENERVLGRGADLWVMAITAYDNSDKTIQWESYYIRNSNFEVACDGMLFTDLRFSDKYVAGEMVDEATYDTKEIMAERSLFSPKFGTEKIIVFGKGGEIVYETSEVSTLNGVFDDYVDITFFNRESGSSGTLISLAPETRGQEIPREED